MDRVGEEYMHRMQESLAFEAYPEVRLPEDAALPQVPLQEAITGRIVADVLEPCYLSLKTVAALLRHSYGVIGGSDKAGAFRQPRAVHSAGSHYPLELFIHGTRVDGLDAGLYHYNPPNNSLRRIQNGDHSHKIAPSFTDRRFINATMTVFIAAILERSAFLYGDRGYRFAMLEAGAVVQNLNLAAYSLGLACGNLGEFYDREIDAVLALDGLTISTVYIVAIGKPLVEQDVNNKQHPIGVLK